MPGKPRSPRAKKPKNSTAHQQLRRDIEAAVDQIPSFIAGQSHEGRKRHSTGQKKLFLWSGVTIITAIIFTMWFWNVRLTIFSTNFKHGAEGKILSNAKNDLQQIFARADVRFAVQELKDKAATEITYSAETSSLEASIRALISAVTTSTPPDDDTTSSTPIANFPLYTTPLRNMSTST